MIKTIAIYLPQFHPIPENDTWWGKGFTEWTNVTRAKPLFKEHYQPHLPADLGFYDLRLQESRMAQESLAKEYGIFGFCYYHYWFNGKRILNEPLDRKLQNPDENLPFMICWANENWTKVWDGEENQVLLKQNYNADDFENHIISLIPILKDSRYLTVNDSKIIAIYRPQEINDIDLLIEIWMRVASENGIKLDIVNFISFGGFSPSFNKKFKFSIDFEPHSSIINYINRKRSNLYNLTNKFLHLFGFNLENRDKNVVLDFQEFNNIKLNNDALKIENDIIPCLIPGFDNSPRKSKNFLILKNNSPEKYRQQVKASLRILKKRNKLNLLFINAWNEWAEGNHLEPCRKWGTKYLEVLKEELDAFNNNL